jgi:adenylate cyclase
MAANEGQRKLTTILAADVAGYSRLMADDDRATVRTLTEYRDIFAEHVGAHQGRIVDTAGDSVLATFESVVEAVEAAVEIQRELGVRNDGLPDHRRMYFRIGVNLGDIIVRDDGTIYGDGVNVAARLEGLAEPGGVMLGDIARQAIGAKLDITLEDAGTHEVKNITEPVAAYRVVMGEAGPSLPAEAAAGNRLRRKHMAAFAAALAVIIGLAVWGLTVRVEVPQMVMADGTPTDDPVLAMPTGPAVAVMPFENFSEDPNQEYFSDGLAEDILISLGRFAALRVLGRDATFQFKGQSLEAREVGQRLGADYVLEGSVRRAGDELRVAVQLLDGSDGTQVWADTYDRTLSVATVFEIQDDISRQIVVAIGGEEGAIAGVELAEQIRKPPESLSSYECYLRYIEFARVFSAENHQTAVDCLEDVVKREPNYADGWAALAAIHDAEMYGINPQPDKGDPVQRAFDAADRALEIDRDNSLALFVIASGHFWRQDAQALIPAAEKAIATNPNDPVNMQLLGNLIFFAGEPDRGMAIMEKAIALAPNPPGHWRTPFALHSYRLGDYDEALRLAKIAVTPFFHWGHVHLVMINGQLGDMEAAKDAMKGLLELRPDYVDPEVVRADHEPWAFGYPGILEHWMEGLEKAGLFDAPEPALPIVAVLPFENLGGDAQQGYFTDGITEDIITRLAQFPGLRVIGRHTAFSIEGDAVATARELGATYVVEGSVRRAGDSVRVSVKLLETGADTHIWAESFDRALDPSNIFAIQDEIAMAISARIGDAHGVISATEVALRARHAPAQQTSYECVLQYHEYIRIGFEEDHARVRDCLERVIAAEPNYAEAYAYLADMYLQEVIFGYNPVSDSSFERMLAMAERGVAIGPDNAVANGRLAQALLFMGERERALLAIEEALRLAPNSLETFMMAGEVYDRTGDFDKALEFWDRAVALNPNYPKYMNWWPARASLARGDFAGAVHWIERTGLASIFYANEAFLAAARCLQGNVADGEAAVARALELKPDWIEAFWDEAEFWNLGGETVALIDVWREGLIACGLDIPERPVPTD